MSLFTSARKKNSEKAAAAVPRQCEHMELAPRWAEAADMGKRDKVTFYACASCGETFQPDEVPDKASV